MSNTIFITANWTTGALSQQTISRQYDNNCYAVQFIGYPEGDGTEELDLYLLVWMSTAPGQKPGEITPIQLNSDQWYISNYFTQQVQVIKFQLCVLNEAGTYEAHSPIFSGRIGDSLEHDGTSQDIDVSTLFDAYREYIEELIIGAGAVIIDPVPTQGSTNAVSSGGVWGALDTLQAQIPQIDSTLTQSGQAADAKAVGDELTNVKTNLNSVSVSINSVSVSKSANGTFIIIDNASQTSATFDGTSGSVRRTSVNYWDEEWEKGYLNVDTGEEVTFANRIRSKNYIPCVYGQVFYYFNATSGVPITVVFFGENKNWIGKTESGVGTTITIPNGCFFFRFYLSTSYGGEYKNDVCINIYDARYNGHYYKSNVTVSLNGQINLLNGYNTLLSENHDNINVKYYPSSVSISYLPKIQLLSYNIRCLRGGVYEAGYEALTQEETEQTLNDFKSLFQKIKPDIFVVCEDRTWFDAGAFATTGGTQNVYDMLFKHYFPYKYNLDTGANAPHIYSKYPFIDSGQIEPVYAAGITNKKPPYVAINVLGNIVYIVGVHPSSDASAYETERIPYFNAIISFCNDKDHVVICGDFNTDTANPETELQPFVNAGLDLGNMGYFGKFATYRWGTAIYIDNVITKGMILNNFTVGDETYSDHFPVSGELNVLI